MTTSKSKWLLFHFVVVLLMAFTIGCGTTDETTQGGNETDGTEDVTNNEQENESESDNTDNTTEETTSPFPVTVVDATGNEIVIESEPETIVTLVPSNTEMTFAVGQGEKVIGVSAYSNYPEEVNDIEKVGSQDINVEKILTLLPDLALVSDYHYQSHSDILQQFKDAGIDVIVVGNAASFDDVYDHMRLIGKVTGGSEQAEEIVLDMQERLAALKEKAKAVENKKRVWVEVSPAPDIYTTGQGTFMHEMLEAVNAINTAGDQEGWIKFTEEEIVTLNPDVIITTYGYYVENPAEQVLNRSGWSEVPAVKTEQVFDVNSDTVTRPGPRLIDGVESLGKLIYPEIFNQ